MAAIWISVSQAVNAGTNVLLTFQLAAVSSVSEFGALAIGLTILPLAVAGMRGFSYEPAVVHGDLSRRAASRVLGDSAVAGGFVALAIVAVVLLLKAPAGVGVLLGVGALAAVVQDGARWLLFGAGRPKAAASLDFLKEV